MDSAGPSSSPLRCPPTKKLRIGSLGDIAATAAFETSRDIIPSAAAPETRFNAPSVEYLHRWPFTVMVELSEVHVAVRMPRAPGRFAEIRHNVLPMMEHGHQLRGSVSFRQFPFDAFRRLLQDSDEEDTAAAAASVPWFIFPTAGTDIPPRGVPMASEGDWAVLMSSIQQCGVPRPSAQMRSPYTLHFWVLPAGYAPDFARAPSNSLPAPAGVGEDIPLSRLSQGPVQDNVPSRASSAQPDQLAAAAAGGGDDDGPQAIGSTAPETPDADQEGSCAHDEESGAHGDTRRASEEAGGPQQGNTALEGDDEVAPLASQTDSEVISISSESEAGSGIGNGIGGSSRDSEEDDGIMEDDDDEWPLPPVDIDTWRRVLRGTCKFFGVTESQMDTKGFTHRIHGTKLGLRPYQLWAVFWILTSKLDRDIATTLLADDMGLGKTITTLAVIAVSHLIRARLSECQEDPDKGGHLPSDAEGSDWEGPLECGTGTYADGFQCPCVPGSWSSRIGRNLSSGPALILAPKELISNWAADFDKFINAEDLGLSLVDLSSPNHNRRGFLATVESVQQRKAKDGTREYDAKLKPRAGQSAFVLLAPSTTAIRGIRANTCQYHAVSQRNRVRVDFAIHPGRIVVDEVHLTKSFQTILWQLVHECFSRATRPLYLLCLSATPMNKDARDLEQIVRFIGYPGAGWSSPLRPPPDLTLARLRELVSQQQRALGQKGRPAFEKVSRDLGVFLRPFTLRRRSNELFGSQPIIDVDPLIYDVDECRTPARFRDAVAAVFQTTRGSLDNMLTDLRRAWEEGGRRTAEPTMQRLLYEQAAAKASLRRLFLCATFPALADRFDALKDEGWTFTGGDLEGVFRHGTVDEVRGSKLWALAGPATEGSAKMRRLGELIRAMLLDNEPLPGVGNFPKKMLIYATLPVTAAIIFAWVAQTFPDVAACLVSYGVRGQIRRDLLHDFERVPSAGSPAGRPGEKRILVTTMGILAEGLNLVRANYCVVVEPHWSEDKHRQAFSRVHRGGQRLSTHLHFLFAPDNHAETIVRNRQLSRSELDTSVWELSSTVGSEAGRM